MINRLQFTNFKSWDSFDISCGSITGIFGTNSSGKTSIIQFLLMLKQTKDASDRGLAIDLNGPFVQLGTYKDVIHRHDDTKSIWFDIDLKLPETLSLVDPSGKRTSSIARSDNLSVSSSIVSTERSIVSNSLRYSIGDIEFSLVPRTQDSTQFDLQVSSDGGNDFSFIRTKGRAWQLPGPIKSYAFPDQARTYYQNAGFLADLEAEYEMALDDIYYLGPLRVSPQRDYLWGRSKPTDVGLRGEKAIEAILAATEDEELRNLRYKSRLMPFQAMIAHWLREMGLIADFSVNEIAEGSNRWQAKIRTKRGSAEVLLTDVGFGVSQVLPVVTLLQYVPEGSTVLLEQPEIHLHPMAQSALADVIIQAATHRKIQIILESHSEHLLLRLQRRIAEEQISNSDVALYFCDAPNGNSSLQRLDVDLYGNILNWPKNFMGDTFAETATAELARLQRMKAA